MKLMCHIHILLQRNNGYKRLTLTTVILVLIRLTFKTQNRSRDGYRPTMLTEVAPLSTTLTRLPTKIRDKSNTALLFVISIIG